MWYKWLDLRCVLVAFTLALGAVHVWPDHFGHMLIPGLKWAGLVRWSNWRDLSYGVARASNDRRLNREKEADWISDHLYMTSVWVKLLSYAIWNSNWKDRIVLFGYVMFLKVSPEYSHLKQFLLGFREHMPPLQPSSLKLNHSKSFFEQKKRA